MTARSEVVRAYVRMGQQILRTALPPVGTRGEQKAYESRLAVTLTRQAKAAAEAARLPRASGAEPAEEEALVRYRAVLCAATGRSNGEDGVWPGGPDWRVLEAQGLALGAERWHRMMDTLQIQTG